MRKIVKRVSLTLIALSAVVSISRTASADETLKIAFDKCPPHIEGTFFSSGGCGLVLCDQPVAAQVVRKDGSGRTSLPHDGDAADRDPAFSPDGRYLAVAQTSRLIIANHDGTNRNIAFDLADIDSRLRVAYPTWSPNGDKIALVAYRVGLVSETYNPYGPGSIWVVASTDGGVIAPGATLSFDEVLPGGSSGKFYLPATARPAWNGNGSNLAFTMAIGTDPVDRLYIASPGAGGWSATAIPSTANLFALGAHWGGRGKIAFAALTPYARPDVRVSSQGGQTCRSNRSGGSASDISGGGGFGAGNMGNTSGIGCVGGFTPTVYRSTSYPPNFDIYTVNPDGTDLQNLTRQHRDRTMDCWYTGRLRNGQENRRSAMQCLLISHGILEGGSFSPQWDPSANTIAFQSEVFLDSTDSRGRARRAFNGYRPFRIKGDGTDLAPFGVHNIPQFTGGAGTVWFFRPAWSPDGEGAAVLACLQNCTNASAPAIPFHQLYFISILTRGNNWSALTNDADGRVGNPTWGRNPPAGGGGPPPGAGPNTGGPTVRHPKMVNACRPYSVDIEIQCDDPDGDLREIAGPYICSGPPEGWRLYTATGRDETIRIAPSRGTEASFHVYWNFWWQADLAADPATGRRASMPLCFYCREVDRDPPLGAWSREPTIIFFPNREECTDL